MTTDEIPKYPFKLRLDYITGPYGVWNFLPAEFEVTAITISTEPSYQIVLDAFRSLSRFGAKGRAIFNARSENHCSCWSSRREEQYQRRRILFISRIASCAPGVDPTTNPFRFSTLCLSLPFDFCPSRNSNLRVNEKISSYFRGLCHLTGRALNDIISINYDIF